MNNDPFARFERSHAGWLIPIGIFIIASLASTWAIATLTDVDRRFEAEVQQIEAIEDNRVEALDRDALDEDALDKEARNNNE